MPLFVRSYSRQVQQPSGFPSADAAGSVVDDGDRVRVVGGALTGLTGRVVSRIEVDHWLIATEQPGVLVRIAPRLLEPVSSA